jgi:hypothetical protein
MQTIPLKPERWAELEKFAGEHGQTLADALDDAVAAYLELHTQDFEEAVAAIQQGYDDVKAGDTLSLEEFDEHMRQKYGIPR